MKVTRDLRGEETNQPRQVISVWLLFLILYIELSDGHLQIYSDQGKTLKSSGWDFSIGGSQGTGTFRSVSRPPQFRDKKTEVSNHQLNQRKTPESGYQGGSANRSVLSESLGTSFGKDLGIPYHDENPDDYLEDVIDSYNVTVQLSLLQKLPSIKIVY